MIYANHERFAVGHKMISSDFIGVLDAIRDNKTFRRCCIGKITIKDVSSWMT